MRKYAFAVIAVAVIVATTLTVTVGTFAQGGGGTGPTPGPVTVSVVTDQDAHDVSAGGWPGYSDSATRVRVGTNTVGDIYAGWHFSGLGVPSDATITSAHVLLTRKSAIGGIFESTFAFENTQSPLPFSVGSSPFHRWANRTASESSWTWPPGDANDVVESPSLIDPLQQLLITHGQIDEVVLLEGPNPGTGAGLNHQWKSMESGGGAELILEYCTPNIDPAKHTIMETGNITVVTGGDGNDTISGGVGASAFIELTGITDKLIAGDMDSVRENTVISTDCGASNLVGDELTITGFYAGDGTNLPWIAVELNTAGDYLINHIAYLPVIPVPPTPVVTPSPTVIPTPPIIVLPTATPVTGPFQVVLNATIPVGSITEAITDVFKVPSGRTFVIQNIHAGLNAGTSGNVFLDFGSSSLPLGLFESVGVTVNTQSTMILVRDDLRLVVGQGQNLNARCVRFAASGEPEGTCTIVLSGELITY